MYKAKKSFSGIISMKKGETKDLKDAFVIKDLLNAGYIEEIEEEAKKIETEVKQEAKKIETEVKQEVEKIETEVKEEVKKTASKKQTTKKKK